MIRLHFASRAGYLRVSIDGTLRRILIEANGRIGEFFLDKMDQVNLDKEQKKLIEAIKQLTTEEEMATDIIKDFQESGWRLTKKE